MRTIGLIGGMSFESSAVYYRQINETVRARLGGLASGDIIMHSVNFEEIVALQKAGRWDQAADRLARVAEGLERAGADCILICTNTMHLVADEVAARVKIPLINIIDETASALQAAGRKRPLLLATRFTMEQRFYLGRLAAFGIEAMVPGEAQRAEIHRVIYEELCRGRIEPASKARYLAIIAEAAAQGADGVILGCTEIGLLIAQDDLDLPVFDTTALHVALDFALAAESQAA